MTDGSGGTTGSMIVMYADRLGAEEGPEGRLFCALFCPAITEKQGGNRMTGYIHSMESMGLVDGPGVRAVVFLQGCPLRCRYCHNPDTQCRGGRPVEDGTLVASVLTQKDLYKKMISNMEEVRTRGAFVMAVTNEGNTDVERVADYVIYIPETNRYFANSLAIIPLQLFGYYVSVGRGCDVDKPRNLAKSVTVE